MQIRGIRGAISVEQNSEIEILDNTKQLLKEIIQVNNIKLNDIISCLFTVTKDLDAVYPAVAARELGWTEIPLICVNEMLVPGSLEKVIRVLLHVNSIKSQNEIIHVYLKRANVLRPDLK